MKTTKAKDALSKLLADKGIDLTEYPPVMKAEQVSEVLDVSVGSLANDRFRGVGIPYTKYGSRIRYLRDDVARYLLDHRVTTASA